jgi:transposase InsO family protein
MAMLQTTYLLTRMGEVLGVARSSFYYIPAAPPEDAWRAAIADLAGQFPTYGSRRIAAQLRREPYQWVVNRKRARRVMGEMGLLRPQKRAPQRTTQSQQGFARSPNLVKDPKPRQPDQVWVSDITYIRWATEFVYLAIVMDVFTRSIRGWCLSRSLGVGLTMGALGKALAQGKPQIHHSDQGAQYAATEYIEALRQVGCAISMAEVGHAEQNGYAERVMRTIKEEEVNLSEYRDFEDAVQQIGRFIDEVYQSKRIHSSLAYLTPAEFEAQWRASHVKPTVPSLEVD